MIWNSPTEAGDSDRALTAYIADALNPSATGKQGPEPSVRQELAESITSFIRNEHGVLSGLPQKNMIGPTTGLPTEYLFLLIERALWSVGADKTAHGLPDAQGRVLNGPATFKDAAQAQDASMLHWHILILTQAVRFSSLTSAPNGAMWVLDIARMVRPSQESIELLTISVLRAAIDHMACLWDRRHGSGLLGIQHAKRVAAGMLNRSRRNSKSMALAADIREQAQQYLQQLRTARRWTETPRVIMLDL